MTSFARVAFDGRDEFLSLRVDLVVRVEQGSPFLNPLRFQGLDRLLSG